MRTKVRCKLKLAPHREVVISELVNGLISELVNGLISELVNGLIQDW